MERAARNGARDYLETLNALAHDLQRADDASDAAPAGRFVSGVFIAPTADANAAPDATKGEDP